jgi:hypothetical protein
MTVRIGVIYVLLVNPMRPLGRPAAVYALFEIPIAVLLAAAIDVPLQATHRRTLRR